MRLLARVHAHVDLRQRARLDETRTALICAGNGCRQPGLRGGDELGADRQVAGVRGCVVAARPGARVGPLLALRHRCARRSRAYFAPGVCRGPASGRSANGAVCARLGDRSPCQSHHGGGQRLIEPRPHLFLATMCLWAVVTRHARVLARFWRADSNVCLWPPRRPARVPSLLRAAGKITSSDSTGTVPLKRRARERGAGRPPT